MTENGVLKVVCFGFDYRAIATFASSSHPEQALGLKRIWYGAGTNNAENSVRGFFAALRMTSSLAP
jgi:hypothetical protein